MRGQGLIIVTTVWQQSMTVRVYLVRNAGYIWSWLMQAHQDGCKNGKHLVLWVLMVNYLL